MELSPEKKIAGILAPLFGLRSDNDLGIGDVAVLREFIDWATEIGFKVVQLLPINEMGHDNSPYNAISAIAIEPTTLHLAPDSPADLTREDCDAALADVDRSTGLRTSLARLRHGPVKYAAVKRLKRRLLEAAFKNFAASALHDRQSSQKKKEFAQREELFRYVQWIAHEQWSQVKDYAKKRGVALMGDIPFGVSYYSADVFS